MAHDVTIRIVLNGYYCKVGCQRLVFTDRKQLFIALDAYLDDPQKVSNEYLTKSSNAKQLGYGEEMMKGCRVGGQPISEDECGRDINSVYPEPHSPIEQCANTRYPH